MAKDLGLFQAVARRAGVELELAPLVADIVDNAIDRYGPRAWSPNAIRRVEDRTGVDVRAPGFPAELIEDEPEAPGVEIGLDSP